MKDKGSLWLWQKCCRRELFLWMAFHPVCLGGYIIFWKVLLELCRYGGAGKRLPVLAGCICLGLLWAGAFIIRLIKYKKMGIPLEFEVTRVDEGRIILGKNDLEVALELQDMKHYRFGKRALYMAASGHRFFMAKLPENCDYLKLKLSASGFWKGMKWLWPGMCLWAVVTIGGVFGVYKSAQPFEGRLGVYIMELRDTRWAELDRSNVYTDGLSGVLEAVSSKVELPEKLCVAGSFNLHFDQDGRILSLDTFLYGFDKEDEFVESYLLSFKEGEKLRIGLHGADTGKYDGNMDFHRLLEGVSVMPLKERAAQWQQPEYGILYMGVRTWQTWDENIIFVNEGRELMDAGDLFGEWQDITGYSISLFVPEKEEIVPYRYLYASQEEWELLREQKLRKEQEAALARENEPVVFADKVIEELVKHELGIWEYNDRPVTQGELAGVTSIGVYHGESISNDKYRVWQDKKVTSLEDLRKFRNLETLCLNWMDIGDLSIFKEMTFSGLRELYLRGSHISDVEALRGLSGLNVLDLSDNEIRDISPLSNLTYLDTLYLDNNRIEDISSIGGIKLRELRAGGNRIHDISVVGSMESLKAVYLDNNLFPEEQAARYLDTRENDYLVLEKKARIGKGMGEFSFQAVYDTRENSEGVIQYVVTDLDSGRIVGQLFTPGCSLFGENGDAAHSSVEGAVYDVESQIRLVDIDFDGYLDVEAIDSLQNRITTHFYLRWVPEEGRYVEDNMLSGLEYPQFDSKKKMIFTKSYDRAGGYVEEGYGYKEEMLTLIWSESRQDIGISQEKLWQIPALAEKMEAALEKAGKQNQEDTAESGEGSRERSEEGSNEGSNGGSNEGSNGDMVFRVKYFEEKERGDIWSDWVYRKKEYQLLMESQGGQEEKVVVVFGCDSAVGEEIKKIAPK